MSAIFAFDFSLIKPAMCAYVNGHLSFYIWSADLDRRSMDALQDCGIKIRNRNLPSVKELKLDENELILEHVRRSTNLANMILTDIESVLKEHGIKKDDCIISNEGFAFSAKGDAVLDLSGYKYILMSVLINAGFTKFRTYSPITLKHTAGCSKKGMGKTDMIESLGNEPEGLHTLIDIMRSSPELLKKKTSYFTCMDDLADSYWCLKTTLKKENIISEITPNGGN